MSGSFSNLWWDRRGNAIVEFALAVPLLVLIVAGMTEIGRAYFQAVAVEKGLRAGALYAAHSASPLGAADRAAAENLVRTGTLDGSGPLLVSGWESAGASLQITSTSFAVGEVSVPVIRFAASVPFDPLLPGLFGFVGLGDFTIASSHEQAYIGD